jgi:hypothetical protein
VYVTQPITKLHHTRTTYCMYIYTMIYDKIYRISYCFYICCTVYEYTIDIRSADVSTGLLHCIVYASVYARYHVSYRVVQIYILSQSDRYIDIELKLYVTLYCILMTNICSYTHIYICIYIHLNINVHIFLYSCSYTCYMILCYIAISDTSKRTL